MYICATFSYNCACLSDDAVDDEVIHSDNVARAYVL